MSITFTSIILLLLICFNYAITIHRNEKYDAREDFSANSTYGDIYAPNYRHEIFQSTELKPNIFFEKNNTLLAHLTKCFKKQVKSFIKGIERCEEMVKTSNFPMNFENDAPDALKQSDTSYDAQQTFEDTQICFTYRAIAIALQIGIGISGTIFVLFIIGKDIFWKQIEKPDCFCMRFEDSYDGLRDSMSFMCGLIYKMDKKVVHHYVAKVCLEVATMNEVMTENSNYYC